jgi:hypothetical protein
VREALRRRSTLLVVVALLAGGAGGFALGRATDDSSTTVLTQQVGPRSLLGLGLGALEVRRAAVLDGARRDFTKNSRPTPPGFEACFLRRFEAKLSGSELNDLIHIRQERGQPAAARALNAIGVSVGDECGGRRYVPTLIAASKQLPP